MDRFSMPAGPAHNKPSGPPLPAPPTHPRKLSDRSALSGTAATSSYPSAQTRRSSPPPDPPRPTSSLVETEFLHIANHADYGAPVIAAIRGNSFSCGLLSVPVMARQATIDHRHGWRLLTIRFLERAAAYQRNSERLEIVRAGYPYRSY